MKLRTVLLSLFAAVLLVPVAARADDRRDPDHRSEWRDDHRHDASCRHDVGEVPAGTPIQRGPGRYELRTVSVWIDGYRDRLFVPERCHVVKHHPRKPWKNKTVCEPAHYEARWVPGHYEERVEYVWVPLYRHRS